MTTVDLGAALWWGTPFTAPSCGHVGDHRADGLRRGLVMSAIKRDRGVKIRGTAIGGHGGVMDRMDSLSFAAPVFFHVVRYSFDA